MVVSILMRKTRISDRREGDSRLAGVVPKIKQVLETEPGFVSLQYLWGLDEGGMIAQITNWQTPDDCRRYVRAGGAATVATLEDAALPTAAHPNGAWVRKTYETAP